MMPQRKIPTRMKAMPMLMVRSRKQGEPGQEANYYLLVKEKREACKDSVTVLELREREKMSYCN